MNVVLGYDPVTLREKVDLAAVGARLSELGEQRSLAALNEKVALLRLGGQLDEAMDVANEAVRQARFSSDREQLLLARVRKAHVMQFQGKLDAALVDLGDCVREAAAHDWASAEAFALHQRGGVYFDLKDYPASLRDFRDALTLRVRIKSSPDLVDSSMVAIAITESFIDAGEG